MVACLILFPPESVITMCSGDDVIVADFGVLRSHESFPWSPGRGSRSAACRKVLVPRPQHTLTLLIQHFALAPLDRLMIYHVTSHGPRLLRGNVNHRDVMFSVTTGRIIVDFVIGAQNSWNSASGFVIKFERKCIIEGGVMFFCCWSFVVVTLCVCV